MRRRIGLEGPAPDEDGFTLIELVIVVVILPIVIGGITVALCRFSGFRTACRIVSATRTTSWSAPRRSTRTCRAHNRSRL